MHLSAARKYTQKTYRQITKAIIRTIKSIPRITPITIHFQLLFSLSSISILVVVVVPAVGVTRAFILDMVVPIAPSSSDLYNTMISTKVLLGNTELFPINNPGGCCT